MNQATINAAAAKAQLEVTQNYKPKLCAICGEPFTRRTRESAARFLRRAACKPDCGSKLGIERRRANSPAADPGKMQGLNEATINGWGGGFIKMAKVSNRSTEY